MNCPIQLLKTWIEQESESGNIFPQGAVLGTVANSGTPRTRMVGTMLDQKGFPKFHTSPSSRKIHDINFNNLASLTYSFQNSLRSVTIEGSLIALNSEELNDDWAKYDDDFRKHYIVFGGKSGEKLSSLNEMKSERDSLQYEDFKSRPNSFVGYKFESINRMLFYSVKRGDFSESKVYEVISDSSEWTSSITVP